MKHNFYTYLLLVASVLFVSSCSKSVEVASVDVPAGSDFSICLELPEDTAQAAKYFYSISFKTKDNFRYTTEGAFTPATATADNCFPQNKMQYNRVAYTEESIQNIQRISNSNIDTLIVTVYSDPLLESKSYVTKRIFTSEDLQ